MLKENIYKELHDKIPHIDIEEIKEKYKLLDKFNDKLKLETKFFIKHFFYLIEKYDIKEINEETVINLIKNDEFKRDLDQILFDTILEKVMNKNKKKVKDMFKDSITKEFENVIECDESIEVKNNLCNKIDELLEDSISSISYDREIDIDSLDNSKLNKYLLKELKYNKKKLKLKKMSNGNILIK